MNQKSTLRTSLLVTLALLGLFAGNLQAQYYPAPAYAPGYAPTYSQGYYGQAYPTQRFAAPAYPAQRAPAPAAAYGYPYRSPYAAPAPMYRPPMPASPYNNRFANRSWGGNRLPWNRGGNRNRSFMPFESNFTPWSRRFWDEIGDGGENPFKDMDDWFDPNDPKEGAARMWDDMLNGPNEMGQMPGGWTAPSISVPNPIDVGDEFRNAAEDMPDEMRNQMDNIDIQTW